jgi:hypothetical protein
VGSRRAVRSKDKVSVDRVQDYNMMSPNFKSGDLVLLFSNAPLYADSSRHASQLLNSRSRKANKKEIVLVIMKINGVCFMVMSSYGLVYVYVNDMFASLQNVT